GNLVCGLEESAGHVHTDECYQTDTWLACGKEEVTEEHVHGEGCFKTIIVEDEPAEAPAEPAKAEEAKPAKAAAAESGEQTFTGELKDADGNVIVSVAVKAPKGALPDDATMRVKAVDEAAIKDKVDEAVKAEAGDNASAKSITAVDIAFLDKDGNEVEPSKKVEVKITSAAVRDIEAPALVHIDEKTDTAEVVRDTTKVNADDKDTSTGNEDTLKFDTDKFSPYVIAEVEVITTQYISANGEAYDVTVTYGPEAKLPEGAWLSVTEYEKGTPEWETARNAVLADKLAKGEEVSLPFFNVAALDISIMDAEGNVVEPAAEVQVVTANLRITT
ncbi:MAG: hypothetical protein IJH42_06255, partial [Atopobiaceae bacterium]|nr:hypothetical protein [Atopobiaceae bacterium]